MPRTRPRRKKAYQSANLDHDHSYNCARLGISSRRAASGHYAGTDTDGANDSEFPSLGPQPQQPNNVAQAWNSTVLRQPQQQTPTQRPSQPQQQQPQPVQQQQQRSVSGQTQTSQQHEPSNLESQYDGQSTTSGRATSEQPQDEFPPLGNQINGRTNGYPQESDGAFGPESSRPARPSNPPGIDHQLSFASSGQQQPPIGQPSAPQQPSQHSNFGPQMVDAPHTNQAAPQQLKPYEDMTDAEKWGLPGMLAKLRTSDPSSAFTMGVDINSLGLDLDR